MNRMANRLIPPAVTERAVSRFVVDEHGCHISTYSVASHGYAQIGWHVSEGRIAGTTAHRAAWTAVHGRIPDRMTVDHLCRQRRCVNVEHLRLLSNSENARRNRPGLDYPLGWSCKDNHDPAQRVEVLDRGKRYSVCSACNPSSVRGGTVAA